MALVYTTHKSSIHTTQHQESSQSEKADAISRIYGGDEILEKMPAERVIAVGLVTPSGECVERESTVERALQGRLCWIGYTCGARGIGREKLRWVCGWFGICRGCVWNRDGWET